MKGFLKKFKDYINVQPPEGTSIQKSQVHSLISPMVPKQISLGLAKRSTEKNEQIFEILMLDILDNSNEQIFKLNQERTSKDRHLKHQEQKNLQPEIIQSLHTSQQQAIIIGNVESQEISQSFQSLVFQEEEHEELQNMYIKDFIFINKLEEARQLSEEQWAKIIKSKNLSLSSMKNIYFSLFKGIKFQIRKQLWQVFANTEGMKKLTSKTYQELIDPESIPKSVLIQIDKDVPRSQSITHFTKQLRNILIGYCALSGKSYTQGMNLIAGSLLTLLALENDEQLEGFEILEKEFEERVFWVFIGVMVEKKWEEIFEKDFEGLKQKFKTLQILMAEHVPAIYQRLIDFEWDLTIFSQFYITIMMYNCPVNLSKIILDLFFLEGENIIHSLIIRMLKLSEDRILGFRDQCQMMSYLKKDMVLQCYNEIIKDRVKAKKLQDFKINFMKTGNQS